MSEVIVLDKKEVCEQLRDLYDDYCALAAELKEVQLVDGGTGSGMVIMDPALIIVDMLSVLGLDESISWYRDLFCEDAESIFSMVNDSYSSHLVEPTDFKGLPELDID